MRLNVGPEQDHSEGEGEWGNLPQAPVKQGPPTNRISIPNIYYHVAG
jgi:hypothetical protein